MNPNSRSMAHARVSPEFGHSVEARGQALNSIWVFEVPSV